MRENAVPTQLNQEDNMKSLAEALPEEQARVRKLIVMYRDLNGAGELAARMMERSLHAVDVAIASGDVVAMIQAYDDLTGYSE